MLCLDKQSGRMNANDYSGSCMDNVLTVMLPKMLYWRLSQLEWLINQIYLKKRHRSRICGEITCQGLWSMGQCSVIEGIIIRSEIVPGSQNPCNTQMHLPLGERSLTPPWRIKTISLTYKCCYFHYVPWLYEYIHLWLRHYG